MTQIRFPTAAEAAEAAEPAPEPEPQAERAGGAPTVTASLAAERVTASLAQQPFKFVASLRATEDTTSERQPLTLCVVIDKSGSMSGPKISMAKATVELLVRELGAADRLALVSYSNGVTTDLGLQLMDKDGKACARAAMACIRSGGGTNMSGGLLQGVEEMRMGTAAAARPAGAGASVGTAPCVLLLSDGHANVGIADVASLVGALKSVLAPASWSGGASPEVMTFGYGEGHDAELMRSLADAGTGMYYNIASDDDITGAFADCVGGLMSKAAQNVCLSLRPAAGATITKVHTDFKTSEHEGVWRVQLGDLYCGEERDIVVTCELPAAAADGEAAAGSHYLAAELRFFDVGTLAMVDMAARGAVVARALVAAEPNLEVDGHWNRICTAEALSRANELGKRGMLEQARDELRRMSKQVTASPCHAQEGKTPSRILSNNCTRDLAACLGGMDDRAAFASRGSKMLSANSQMHQCQRSNFSSPSSAMYTTKRKSTMQTSWGVQAREAAKTEPPPRSAPSRASGAGTGWQVLLGGQGQTQGRCVDFNSSLDMQSPYRSPAMSRACKSKSNKTRRSVLKCGGPPASRSGTARRLPMARGALCGGPPAPCTAQLDKLPVEAVAGEGDLGGSLLHARAAGGLLEVTATAVAADDCTRDVDSWEVLSSAC